MSSQFSQFETECLAAHNEYRAKHGVQPLTLSRQLCQYSAEWANNIAQRGKLQHRTQSPYGENLYWSMGMAVNGKTAVESWYSEISGYVFGKEPRTQGAGHFTQVVWSDSRELGAALVSRGGQNYVVCNYSPPGNMIGSFSAKVPPIGGFAGGAVVTTSRVPNATPSVVPNIVEQKTSNSQFSQFETECLAAHNEYRAKHGAPPLILSRQLCQYSAEWANNIAQLGKLQHRTKSQYGENLYWSMGMVVTGKTAVESWYSEISGYVFGKEPRTLEAGHFTQVVWSDSRELGAALVSRGGQNYVVCNYGPPGNMIGSFSAKVPPIGGFAGGAIAATNVNSGGGGRGDGCPNVAPSGYSKTTTTRTVGSRTVTSFSSSTSNNGGSSWSYSYKNG